jgi:SOS regulatory protein LexA
MSDDTLCLQRLQDYYAQEQVLPSYATIGGLLGLRSKNSVAALVGRLRLQGYLAFSPDRRLKPGPRFFERPLHESVQAGLPREASQGTADTVTIDRYLIEHPSQTVMVRVRGESMRDAGVLDGDLAVVERRYIADVGDIVVASIDGEFTLKYLDRDREGHFLRPANPAFGNIRAAFEIFGVMVGLVRKY